MREQRIGECYTKMDSVRREERHNEMSKMRIKWREERTTTT